MEDILTDRKKKILKAIIKTYMETGEPVGSGQFPSIQILMSAQQQSEMKCLT